MLPTAWGEGCEPIDLDLPSSGDLQIERRALDVVDFKAESVVWRGGYALGAVAPRC